MTDREDGVFITVEEALARMARGEQIIVVDDEDRENEGDLIFAADKVTPEAINFMARYGRGLVCASLTPSRCDALELPLMVEKNTSTHGTAFTVSVEVKEGTTTGISAHDRVGRREDGAERPPEARAHVSAASTAGRRAQAGRSHRGIGRSRENGRAHTGGRAVRDHG